MTASSLGGNSAPLQPMTAPFASASAASSALKSGKTEKAAREFESVLLTSLLDALQKSFSFDAQDDTPGTADYRLMGTRAMAEAVSGGGGIGIARLILSHLHTPKGQGAK
jgi:Rod binding domain-containing protein